MRTRPRHALGTLLVALLTLTVVTAPAAVAASPPATPWSPATVPAPVSALALAKESGAMVLGTGDPDENDRRDADLHFLRLNNGLVASHEDGTLFNEGTSAVAVSREGEAYAAGARGTDGANLHYFTAGGVPEAAWSKILNEGVSAIALSDNGEYAAVVTTGAGSLGVMYLYDDAGQLLTSHENEGGYNDVAISADGRWIVAVGRVQAGETRNGVVHLYSRAQGGHPVFTETIEEGAAGDALTVAMTPDGRYFAAGTAAGRVYSFHRDGASVAGPRVMETGATLVADVAISADGHAVVAGHAGGVHYFTRQGTSSFLNRAWNHSTGAAVESVDVSDDGAYVVAASPSASQGAIAYHASRATPIWSLQGGADHAAVNGNATHAVFTRTVPGAEGAQAGAVEAYALHHSVEMGFSGPGDTVVNASEVKRVSPFEAATYDLVVTNRGSVRDVFQFEFPTPSGWDPAWLRTSPGRLDLLPEESAAVELTVTPGRVAPGTHALKAVVRSTLDPTTAADVAFSLQVRSTAGVAVQLQGGFDSRTVETGQTRTALFRVANHGNEWVNLTTDLTQQVSDGPRWDVSVNDAPARLGPGSTTTLTLTTRVPRSAPDGAQNAVTLSIQGGNATDAATVVYLVNPYAGVDLASDATAKFVNATRPARFNLTVTNTGSVSTDYYLTWTKQETGTQGWTVSMDTETFTLGRSESRRVPVSIHAPHNGDVGDHVVVQVTVLPDDEFPELWPRNHDNVTIAAKFHLFPEDDKSFAEQVGNVVPAPGVGLLVAFLAVALVRPRRRGAS